MGRGLATIDPLRLPGVLIRPATCEVEADDRVEQLEPRMMQVLVELVEAQGRVVARDTLVERCWDGLSVGDDAINRVTARLRRLGQETGAFTLETIRKVGYRLVPADADGDPGPVARIELQRVQSPRRRLARARAVANVVVLAVVAAVMFRFGNRLPEPAAAAPAGTTTTPLSLQRLPGRWGPAGCQPTYDIVIREGRVVMTAPGYRSERRIIAADDAAITTEGVLPTTDRGKVIELRPDGERLAIQDRTTNRGDVFDICPAARR